MGVTLTNLSGKGRIHGNKFAVENYSVNEDSTPLVPGDSSGGVGALDVDFVATDNTIFFSGNDVQLSDSTSGYTTGRVSGFSVSNSSGSLTAETRLNLLNVVRQTKPIHGTLGDAFTYYFSLVGITDKFFIDTSIASRPVVYQGINENLWTYIKEICVTEQIELSPVSGNIYVRPVRERVAYMPRNASIGYDVDVVVADEVNVKYYPSVYKPRGVAYPPANDLGETFAITPGEATVLYLDISASLTWIEQPVVTTSVARKEALLQGPASSYIVSNEDGEVDPDDWSLAGGYMVAEIDPENDRRIKLTVYGAANPTGEQWQLGFPVDESTYGGAIVIVGTGVFYEEKQLTWKTAADPAYALQDSAPTFDSTTITSYAKAAEVAARLVQEYSGPNVQLRVTASRIHKPGENSSGRFVTIDEFNAEVSGLTFDAYNATVGNLTFDELNAIYDARYADDFTNQAFGNVGGARVKYNDNIFRIRTARINYGNLDYTAESDTTIDDFNDVWSTGTFDDFNASVDELTFDELAVVPLRRQ